MTPRLLLPPALLLLISPFIHADDWPRFRGPDGVGVVESGPTEWAEGKNVAWKVDIAGRGWSAPIVSAGRVVVTSVVPPASGSGPSQYNVLCFDAATGEPVWERTVLEAVPPIPTHRDNTYASETPVTDGERIFAYFGLTTLACLDFSGEVLWQKEVPALPMRNDWGTSSSPAYFDGAVYLQVDNEQKSYLACYDAATGEERWRVDRPDENSNWCSPFLWENSQRAELVVGGKTVRSYDPATGKELWSMLIGGRTSSFPVAVGDVVYVGSENRTRRGGTPGGFFAVKAGASGDIDVTNPNAAEQGLAWAQLDGAIGISSPLVFGDEIYVPERRSILRVHSASTGELLYEKRLPGARSFWTSPWACAGRVFVLDENGTTYVLAPGGEFNLLGQNKLPGRFWSTPALTDGAVLLRSETQLFCLRVDQAG